MKIGDTVTWKSQSKGIWKEKTGTIVEVVPSWKRPEHKIPGTKVQGNWVCLSREDESYVVQVGRKFYWPRVSKLNASR